MFCVNVTANKITLTPFTILNLYTHNQSVSTAYLRESFNMCASTFIYNLLTYFNETTSC